MQLNKDYKFRDDLFKKIEEGSTTPIEILVDPYKGVCYRYTAVVFKTEEDPPRMVYAYDILDAGKFSETTLRKDEYFIKMLGVILNAVLLEVAEHENRGNDSEE